MTRATSIKITVSCRFIIKGCLLVLNWKGFSDSRTSVTTLVVALRDRLLRRGDTRVGQRRADYSRVPDQGHCSTEGLYSLYQAFECYPYREIQDMDGNNHLSPIGACLFC